MFGAPVIFQKIGSEQTYKHLRIVRLKMHSMHFKANYSIEILDYAFLDEKSGLRFLVKGHLDFE